MLQQPDFLFATLNLGIVHAVVGNYEQADAFFEAAVEIDPNDLGTRHDLAESAREARPDREAAFQWVAAVEIDRDDPLLRQELARPI